MAIVAACALGAPGTVASGAAPGRAYVRVNQAGYATGAPKRAYLLAPAAEPRATFALVRAGGGVVLRGRLGPDLGVWSARFPHVYAIDFSRLRRPGAYTVTVAGALAAAPIRNALAFYQDERDGPAFIRSALRTAPGHRNDAHAMTYRTPKVDATASSEATCSRSGSASRRPAGGGTRAIT